MPSNSGPSSSYDASQCPILKLRLLSHRLKKGNFPQCFKVGIRAVGWLSSDIDAWIESRAQLA
jgi:predicted DNA-binding transcriptional regulator AlpA